MSADFQMLDIEQIILEKSIWTSPVPFMKKCYSGTMAPLINGPDKGLKFILLWEAVWNMQL